MRDNTLGMILATAIAAPVVILCCGGGIALLGAALAGVTGYLSGASILGSALIAVIVGILWLAMRRLRRARRTPEPDIRGDNSP